MLRRRFQKFVVDVQIQHITDLQTRGDFRTLAVELDTLDADIFIQQRLRQIRKAFGQILIQTLIGVVFFNHYGFQCSSSFVFCGSIIA